MTHANLITSPRRNLSSAALLAGLLLVPAITASAQTAPSAASGATTMDSPRPAQAAPGVIPGTAPVTGVQPIQNRIQPLPQPAITPLPHPILTPELAHLIELETRFAADVAKGGGRAFASWFAPDAVTLNNGQPAVLGSRDITAHATWDPKEYQLTWQPEGAQLSASGDMGFTWGHYETTTSHPPTGQPAQSSGRYITIWKRMPGGDWKVALDASANDAGQNSPSGQRSAPMP